MMVGVGKVGRRKNPLSSTPPPHPLRVFRSIFKSERLLLSMTVSVMTVFTDDSWSSSEDALPKKKTGSLEMLIPRGILTLVVNPMRDLSQ